MQLHDKKLLVLELMALINDEQLIWHTPVVILSLKVGL
jgi:hypothetical protein